MATFQEMLKRLEYLVDDRVKPDDAIMLFNECNEDLSEAAGYSKVGEAEFVAEQSFISVPEDLMSLVELKIKLQSMPDHVRMLSLGVVQPSDTYTNQLVQSMGKFVYEWHGDHMEIRPTPAEAGTLLIRYYAKLPDFKESYLFARGEQDQNFLLQKPVIRPNYHRLYSLYAAARYMQNWQDALNEKSDFMNEYLEGKEQLYMETLKRKVRGKSRTVYRHGDFL